VSSRASVVVQLAQKRSKGKGKKREKLVEASDRVARALEELAEMEAQPEPDVVALEQLAQELDEQQATLFDILPSPQQKRRSTSTRDSVRKSMSRGSTVVQLYEKHKGKKKPNEKLIVAAEKVAQTLEELGDLQDDPTCADDELAVLVDEATRQQRELLTLTKDQNNFVDQDEDEFLNDF
jgi:hypothetical protein